MTMKTNHHLRPQLKLLLAVCSFFLTGLARSSVVESDLLIGTNTPYSEAAKLLTVAGFKEFVPFTMVNETNQALNYEVHTFGISAGVTLVLQHPATSDGIKGVSLNCFPTNSNECTSLAVRSIEFKADGSYVVHFEAPTK